ncbi:hypothetical protein BDV29DRAFT_152814 [Aspergillus leporis]|uniref:FAR1 domain-containing protein n=1 Tax=Aspergillus leporis TaxID=41062 RepID=A0A5N5XDR1_9EURO|nr:hypothetical protein BDV29DRAFT_152814 [Aspergillus leporis]
MDDFFDDFEITFSDESDREDQNENGDTTIPAPPLYQSFSSADEAFDSLQAFGLINDFAVTKRRSTKDRRTGSLRYIDIVCDRDRTTENQSQGICVGRSRRPDYPFIARLKLNTVFETWSLTVQESSHNHGPAAISVLPAHRRGELRRWYDQVVGMLNEEISITYDIGLILNASMVVHQSKP